MANTKIQLRKSGVSGNVPNSLDIGELALNYADGKLYYKNAENVITFISSGETTNSFATINANSSLIFATSNTDTLSIVAGNNINVSACTSTKTITISASKGAANIVVDNTSNIAGYITFTDTTVGGLNTLYVSDEKLTYNPASGALRLNVLEVTANNNISANTKVIGSTTPTILDSFSAEQYRGAFYQVQMESGGSFHVLNLSIVNSGGSAQVSTFGDAFNSGPLATFATTVVSGQLLLTITPTTGSTTVSFLRHLVNRLTVGIPTGDLGLISEAATVFFDAGFDSEATTNTFDYGYLS